jgi:ankyrin repeat protein
VSQKSAKAQFGERVPKIPLLANHHRIVKFSSAHDRLYRKKVEGQIKSLVHKALDRQNEEEKLLRFQPSGPNGLETMSGSRLKPRFLKARTQDEASRDLRNSPEMVEPMISTTVGAECDSSGSTEVDTIGWVEDIINELRASYDGSQLNRVTNASFETCNWMLSKDMYRNWRSSSQHELLILQGRPGVGKSVLAKFIVQQLTGPTPHIQACSLGETDDPERNFIITHFFTTRNKGNHPLDVIKHILFQVWDADSVCVETCAASLASRVQPHRDLIFFVSLFTKVRRRLQRSLICVVDGVDESLPDSGFPSQSPDHDLDIALVRWFQNIADENAELSNSTVKLLLTTRPTAETVAIDRPHVTLLKIEGDDIAHSVAKVIEASVNTLAEERTLSQPARDFIEKEISTRAGSLFLMVNIALQALRHGEYDLENEQTIQRVLERLNPEDLRSAYESILERIPAPDHGRAAKIIRILFFAHMGLDISDLNQALAINSDDPKGNYLDQLMPRKRLLSFIRSRLGSLVAVIGEKFVELSHHTVHEFFQNLSQSKWPAFNCENRQEGNLSLALLCVRCLIGWHHQQLTVEELEAHQGNEMNALFAKSDFLRYALLYWKEHVREAGTLIDAHMGLINKLLGLNGESQTYYHWMLRLQDTFRRGDKSNIEWKPIPPAHYLAIFDLNHILQTHLQYPLGLQQRLMRSLRKWRRRKPSVEIFDLEQVDWWGSTLLHDACQCGNLEIAISLLEHGARGDELDSTGHTCFSLAVGEGHADVAEMLIMRGYLAEGSPRPNGLSSLHMASFHGMKNIVETLLSNNVSPNVQDSKGWTPVHMAAQAGRTPVLEILLAANGAPDAATSTGLTPLHLAAVYGHLSTLECLLDYAPELDPVPLTKRNSSPLHMAVECGHAEVVDLLMQKRAEVGPDVDGFLPIHLAALGGHLSIIERLINRTSLKAANNLGKTALHIAAFKGHLDVVECLVRLGTPLGIEIDAKCKDLTLEADKPDQYLLTPLYSAVIAGHLPVVEYLISQGADVTVKSALGWTLLHEAAGANEPEMFDLLLDQGLDSLAESYDGSTPLHEAAKVGCLGVVDRYLGMTDGTFPHVDAVEESGKSPLLIALSNNHAEIAERLIAGGANVHVIGHDNQSAVVKASRMNKPKLMKTLLTANVDVNIPDPVGWTALHFAANNASPIACALLLEYGAKVDAKTQLGQTALMMIAGRGDQECCRALLDAEADPCLLDSSGLSAFEYARNSDIVHAMLEKKAPTHRPLSWPQRKSLMEVQVRDLLKALPSAEEEYSNETFNDDLLSNLGLVFLRLKEYDAARICLEYFTSRNEEGEPEPRWYCDKCGKIRVVGAFYFCKNCVDTCICCVCYGKRSDGDFAAGCKVDHEYLELGGEVWKGLRKGKVNVEGESIWGWIMGQKGRYGVGDGG